MHLQQAIAVQIANNEARTEISGIDIADAGNVLAVIDRFLRHNGYEKAADALHSEHMP